MNSLGTGFNRLWAASLSSNLADGFLRTAAPLVAVALTDDPVKISLLAAIVMLPWLFFAIPVGGLVDRVDRRKAIAFANFIRFLVAAVAAYVIAIEAITIEILYLVAFIVGVCEVVSDTAAQAMVPQLLDQSQFESGNSRLHMSETIVSGFVGAPSSGFLYAAAVFLPFIATSLGFLVAAALVLYIPIQIKSDLSQSSTGENPNEKFLASLRFGLAYLYRDKRLFRLVITTTAIGFAFSAASAISALFMIKQLGLAPIYFGIVLSVQGIGALLGAATTTRWTKSFSRGDTMAFGMIITTLATFALGFSSNIFIFTALSTLSSYFISIWNILLMSTYQTIIPNELFGRIHGARRTLVWGMMPLGSVVGGFIGTLGLAMPFFVGGAAATFIAVLNYRFIRSIGQAGSFAS